MLKISCRSVLLGPGKLTGEAHELIFSEKVTDTEFFLTERLVRLYVAAAVSKGREVPPGPTRSPILQTVKISQSRTAVAAGELFVVEEKKPELLTAWLAWPGRLQHGRT